MFPPKSQSIIPPRGTIHRSSSWGEGAWTWEWCNFFGGRDDGAERDDSVSWFQEMNHQRGVRIKNINAVIQGDVQLSFLSVTKETHPYKHFLISQFFGI
jgi:hypothetical protein